MSMTIQSTQPSGGAGPAPTPGPISRDAVVLRLHPANWPEELKRDDLAGPSAMARAIEEASSVFAEYEATRDAAYRDPKLTPAGAHAAVVAWAATKLPTLQRRLEDIGERAEAFEESRAKIVEGTLGAPPTEPADVAMLQEIRTYLRGLPEADRTRRVFGLVEKGDRTALRAVLTAPTYLTGVNDELITLLRDEVFKHSEPTRDAKHQAYRKAIQIARRAVDGVARLIRQELALSH